MQRFDYTKLIGTKLNRLTILEFMGTNKHGNKIFSCLCDCGNTITVYAGHLKNGNPKSCGCYAKEVKTKHNNAGLNRTTEYVIWLNIKQRCFNKSLKSYSNYGGRGISICERWKHSFENFLSDMGRRPTSKHSIERINNDKNYEPENCCWATRKVQANNTRTNVFFNYNGDRLTISQLAEKYKINFNTLYGRLFRTGLPINKAIESPKRKPGRKVSAKETEE